MLINGDRRKTFAPLACCVALLGFIGCVFWYQDWRYSLPTPRPPAWSSPEIGARLELVGLTAGPEGLPTLLHFFNPDCPCSRFNLEHVRELIAGYRGRVRFVAVLQWADPAAATASFRRLRLAMEAIPDPTGGIARTCGVYSTPQAVVLDSRGGLQYRGNYNASRYCTNRASEYARIALDSLLGGEARRSFPVAALTAYGCPLPRKR